MLDSFFNLFGGETKSYCIYLLYLQILGFCSPGGIFHFDDSHGFNSIYNAIFEVPEKCVFVRSVHGISKKEGYISEIAEGFRVILDLQSFHL